MEEGPEVVTQTCEEIGCVGCAHSAGQSPTGSWLQKSADYVGGTPMEPPFLDRYIAWKFPGIHLTIFLSQEPLEDVITVAESWVLHDSNVAPSRRKPPTYVSQIGPPLHEVPPLVLLEFVKNVAVIAALAKTHHHG